MKTFRYFFYLMIIFICACKNETPLVQIQTGEYYPMSVGNYWIYEDFELDTTGILVSTQKFDTLTITGTTTFGNESYFVFERKTNQLIIAPLGLDFYRRDSSGYLIDEHGTIFFSEVNDTDYLRIINFSNTFPCPPFQQIKSKMDFNLQTIETPVGIFECKNFKGEYYSSDPTPIRYSDRFHSPGVGLVQSSIPICVPGVSGPNGPNEISSVSILIDFHVN